MAFLFLILHIANQEKYKLIEKMLKVNDLHDFQLLRQKSIRKTDI